MKMLKKKHVFENNNCTEYSSTTAWTTSKFSTFYEYLPARELVPFGALSWRDACIPGPHHGRGTRVRTSSATRSFMSHSDARTHPGSAVRVSERRSDITTNYIDNCYFSSRECNKPMQRPTAE